MFSSAKGSKDKPVKAFDARCYNQLFADESPETLFISQGGAGEVIRSEHLVTILKSIARGIDVQKLIDRDDMTDGARSQKIAQGIRVLSRREIEEYLYDPEVLRRFLETAGCGGSVVEEVLHERESLVNGHAGPNNVKDVSRELFAKIRKATGLPNLGNNRDEFAAQFLVPALGGTPCVVRGTPGRRVRQRLTLEASSEGLYPELRQASSGGDLRADLRPIEIEGPHVGVLRGAGVPVVVSGQDDVIPAQRRDVPEQARLRQLAPPSQVVCGFVHVQGVPVHDRGDDQVQGHDALLLSVVRPVSDAALGMGEHRARQCVACLALVQTRLALHAQLRIFDPVQHEQRALDAPDFAERKVECTRGPTRPLIST